MEATKEELSMYIVNFNTGAGNLEATTLEEAKQLALDGMAYTQQNITIEKDGKVVTTARWYGVAPTDEDYESGIVLEEIGGGFYTLWDDELENMI